MFQIRLEVVSVLHLLLGQTAKVDRVVIDHALTFALEHTLLATLVVVGVVELSRVEFLDSVEYAIELADGKLNVVPCLVLLAAEWSWKARVVALKRVCAALERAQHSVELLVDFLGPLELVGWVDENAV